MDLGSRGIVLKLCCKNKVADQLRSYREADLRLCFRICKNPVFSRRGSYIKAKSVEHQWYLSLVTRKPVQVSNQV